MEDVSSPRLDLRLVTVILLAVIAGMLYLWRPWDRSGDQTITVTGQGTVTAIPDTFIFSPSYQKKAASSEQAIADVSELGNGVLATLKKLGVADVDLKTSISGGQDFRPIPMGTPPTSDPGHIAIYSITATAHTVGMAEKIQSYIATTPVQYAVSPAVSFSKDAQTTLEQQARDKALANARSKAEHTVAVLGTRLGKLKSVSDASPVGQPIMYDGKGVATAVAPSSAVATPTLEVGSQEFSFSITAVYLVN